LEEAKEKYEAAIEEIKNTEGLAVYEMDSEGNIRDANGNIEPQHIQQDGENRMSLEDYNLIIEEMRAESSKISSEMPNYNSGIPHSKIKDEDNIMHQ